MIFVENVERTISLSNAYEWGTWENKSACSITCKRKGITHEIFRSRRSKV